MPVQSRKSIQARKIGTSLVAAYPGASPPLVWKFDLEKNHSFTLALQGEEGDWELGVTSPRGEFYPVARFLTREDADEAFARTQKALMAKQHDKLYDSLWNIWGRISLVLVCLQLILMFVSVLFHGGMSRPLMSPNAAKAPAHAETPMEMLEGVPLPADQVLKPPP